MSNWLVSIITPTYNHEAYIAQCIEGVLAQTYSNWELIILDDGSTDQTQQVVRSYRDRRIRYYWQEHKGISSLGKTYNKALGLSRGELVAILEGDDCWPSDKLEKQLPLFSDNEVVLTWGLGKLIDEGGHVLGLLPPAWEEWPIDVVHNVPIGRALQVLLFHNFFLPAATIMVRKQTLVEAGGFWQPPGVYWVDHPTWLRIALKGRFSYVPEVLGYWRIHRQQVSFLYYHMAKTTGGEVFWSTLSDMEKKNLGLEKMGRPLQAWSWWIYGRRATLRGERRTASRLFFKALLFGHGALRLRACVALLMLLCTPRLLVSEFAYARPASSFPKSGPSCSEKESSSPFWRGILERFRGFVR